MIARMPGGLLVPQFVDAPSSHPAAVRALNRVARWIPRRAPEPAEAWWEAARRGGLEDCEPTAEARAALEVLAGSIQGEVGLNGVGRLAARTDTIRMARTHLRVHRALRQRPAIAETPLPAPVFIVGWPRTGTTFLHQLLSQDPDNRTLPYWESYDPVPPEGGTDDRARRLARMLRTLEWLAPGYQAIHPMEADLAEECVALFNNELRTLQYDFQYRTPSYVRWLLEEDAGLAYAAYRRQLQLVQHHRPCGTRFVLKDPTHIVHLETVVDQFPDARFVFTHRDPTVALSSICSLTAYTRAIFSDDVDPEALGREIFTGYWTRALESAQEVRCRIPAERQVDVRHPDLARDPVGTARRIYQALGLSGSEPAFAAMERFVSDRRTGPRHRHVHALEGFGLQRGAVRERFKAYCERFDLGETAEPEREGGR